MKLKDAMLVCEDAVYHIQCGSNFRTDQGNPKKSVMSKKRGRDTTTDKERVFLEIAEHIDSHSGGQFDITILEKIMEKNWVVIMFYNWFKQIYFADPLPYRYRNANYVTKNKWLFQQKIPRPENFAFIVILVFKVKNILQTKKTMESQIALNLNPKIAKFWRK